MKTLKSVLQLSIDFLKTKNCFHPRRTAEEVISDVLGLKRLDLYLQFDRPMEESELEKIRACLKRAAHHEPIQYILSKQSFYGCDLKINPSVLIPRPETEILIDHVCRHLEGVIFEGQVAWDVCTGSGCLGLALKKKFPEMKVVLSDLSSQAVQVAKENAAYNQLDVEVLEGDLLEPFKGRKADVFLCNPPYVSLKEYELLDVSVKGFEPREALVAGEDGLDFYRRLHDELPPFLNKGAKLFFEIGSLQGKALQSLFVEPFWKKARAEKDWAGHERFFFLEFE